MPGETRLARFEALVLVHLHSGWRFARWLVRDESLAEDALQEACVKALRAFDTLNETTARGWFMAIVRNACLDALRERSREAINEPYDEAAHASADTADSPEEALVRTSEARWIRAEVARLPPDYREAIVLREFEGLTYREISEVVRVPIGTVMSRLARGREILAARVRARREREQA